MPKKKTLTDAEWRKAILTKKFFTSADVARCLTSEGDPWDERRARRWLVSTGAGVKRGGQYIATRESLVKCWPELYAEIRAEEAEAAELQDEESDDTVRPSEFASRLGL